MATLLTIINKAQDKLRLPRSNAVIASTDPNVRTLLAMADEEGDELAREYKWQELQREHSWTATATESQADGLPDDFESIVPNSFYNRTRRRRVIGPLSSQEWQYQASVVTSTVYDSFFIRNDELLISPTPTAGDVYAYEYETVHWCQSDGGTAQRQWLADNDVPRLDEVLFILGIEWRWRADRGLPFETKFQRYKNAVDKRASTSGGRSTISISGAYQPSAGVVVQDGSWDL